MKNGITSRTAMIAWRSLPVARKRATGASTNAATLLVSRPEIVAPCFYWASLDRRRIDIRGSYNGRATATTPLGHPDVRVELSPDRTVHFVGASRTPEACLF